MLVEVPENLVGYLFHHGEVKQLENGPSMIQFSPYPPSSISLQDNSLSAPKEKKMEESTPVSSKKTLAPPNVEESHLKEKTSISYAEVARAKDIASSLKESIAVTSETKPVLKKNEEKHSSDQEEYQEETNYTHVCNHCGGNLKEKSACNSFCHANPCKRWRICHYIHMSKDHLNENVYIRLRNQENKYLTLPCRIVEISFNKYVPEYIVVQLPDSFKSRENPIFKTHDLEWYESEDEEDLRLYVSQQEVLRVASDEDFESDADDNTI